jgi:hypothetical protein
VLPRSPDSTAVVFQALNREQTFLDLNAASDDGSVKKVFQEIQTPGLGSRLTTIRRSSGATARWYGSPRETAGSISYLYDGRGSFSAS